MEQLYANKTVLQGFIASDLKLEPTKNGGQRCFFDIKVVMASRKKIEFIPITLWNAYAEQFVKTFHKGDNIQIEGELLRNSGPDGRKYLVISCGIIRLIVPASSSLSEIGHKPNYAQKSSFTKSIVKMIAFFIEICYTMNYETHKRQLLSRTQCARHGSVE